MRNKLILDCLMLIVLMVLMPYLVIGETEHEYLGVAMAILILIHQAANLKWYRNLTKGKYTFRRILLTAINFLLLILMALQVFSGMLLSKELFIFWLHDFNVSTFRLVHLALAYWLYVLIGVHIGLHWRMILSSAKISVSRPLKILAMAIAAYGVYALISRQFLEYMTLASEFVFFDFDEPLMLFFFDYAAILALFIFVGNKL